MCQRLLLALGVTLFFGACSGDDDDDHHGHELSAECQAIVDACHEVDTGEGRISECHETAHDDDTAFCASDGDDCIATCEAAAADQ